MQRSLQLSTCEVQNQRCVELYQNHVTPLFTCQRNIDMLFCVQYIVEIIFKYF